MTITVAASGAVAHHERDTGNHPPRVSLTGRLHTGDEARTSAHTSRAPQPVDITHVISCTGRTEHGAPITDEGVSIGDVVAPPSPAYTSTPASLDTSPTTNDVPRLQGAPNPASTHNPISTHRVWTRQRPRDPSPEGHPTQVRPHRPPPQMIGEAQCWNQPIIDATASPPHLET